MPNYVYTNLEVTGPEEVLKEFVAAHMCDEVHLEFNTIIPMPAALDVTAHCGDNISDEQKANQEKYGFTDWYGWRVDNWGTKWGAGSCELKEREDGKLLMYFETAWSIPEKIFTELNILYPELTFMLDVVEEGGFFAGTIQFSGDVVVDGLLSGSDLTEEVYDKLIRKMKPEWYEDEEEEVDDTPLLTHNE